MDTRRPTAEITNGPATKSDKIRALAQTGYNRAEIARHLGIIYQHVRNVPVQSGFTGGLCRDAETER